MFEIVVAMRHIRSRRRQTLLAVGAVALAVAITITSRASVNGFQEVLMNIIFQSVPHVVVEPKDGEEYIYLYRTLTETIWTLPGIAAVSPSLFATATLSHEDNVDNVILKGVIPSELVDISGIDLDNMVEGTLVAIQNGRRTAISRKMADGLDVKVGDTIKATFPDSKPMDLTVVAIFDTGGAWDDFAFVSLETARKFLGEEDVVNSIEIKLDDIYAADGLAAEISASGYKARSWQALFPEILRTIKLESFSNNVVMVLIMVISSFGIANVMNMLVLEKTKEIGMLMALGASPSDIRKLFVLEAGVLGAMGGILGCLLGTVLSFWLDSLHISAEAPGGLKMTLPFLVEPWDLLAFGLLALVLSMAAGLYPAHRASRLDPIAALKG